MSCYIQNAIQKNSDVIVDHPVFTRNQTLYTHLRNIEISPRCDQKNNMKNKNNDSAGSRT